jgi:hypothetical protein
MDLVGVFLHAFFIMIFGSILVDKFSEADFDLGCILVNLLWSLLDLWGDGDCPSQFRRWTTWTGYLTSPGRHLDPLSPNYAWEVGSRE